ncbi:MAG: VanZ family protein [Phycisphaerae bacterium]|nr:VanZ family protein [Gemmatimonadaceae bacterium]
MKLVRPTAFAAALLLIAAATLWPGTSEFTGPLRPDFWCLACGASGGADVTANIALFVPLGVMLGLMSASPFRVMMIGAAISASIELAQRYGFPPARVANATDILTNSLGALCGALLMHSRRYWLIPDKRHATMLALGSGAMISGFCLLTAWALGPLHTATTALPFRSSAYPFTPGYGWYHGFVTQVVVNADTFAHKGDGPVILRGSGGASRTIGVQLSGRDERAGFVPFVYLHEESLLQPALLLGQEKHDARLSVLLRGSRIRLPGPHILLPGAFSNSVQTLALPHTIETVVTPLQWSLASVHDGTRRHVDLRVTMGLGWTLFQTVVGNTPWVVALVSAIWMMVLWVPLGYWCCFGGDASGPTSVTTEFRIASRNLFVGLGVLALTLGFVPAWAGIAANSWVEWTCAFAGFGSGVFFASRVWRNHRRLYAGLPGHRHLSETQ